MTTVLTRDEIDLAFSQPNKNGFGKSRYDIANEIEAMLLEKAGLYSEDAGMKLDHCHRASCVQIIESLTRENAQLRAVIAEQEESLKLIAETNAIQHKVIIKQSALIEKLGEALSNCIVDHIEKPFVALAAWRVREALAELAAWREK